MRFFSRIRNYSKEHGLIKTFQKGLQRMIGVEKESIDTLYYFLNTNLDITSIPPTKDMDLRLMQLCDAELLLVIDKVCQKYCIKYWLDFGTLLGAKRHKGFIPWDDDMDISMSREDYDKFLNEPAQELRDLGFDVSEEVGRIGVGYDDTHTGVWLDIFAKDTFCTKLPYSEAKPMLIRQLDNYIHQLDKRKDKTSLALRDLRLKCVSGDGGDNEIMFLGVEFDYPKYVIHIPESIFPLSRMQFESYEFYVPNDVDTYLKEIYGNYMSFPTKGLAHHTTDGIKQSELASKHSVNMNDVLTRLRELNKTIV